MLIRYKFHEIYYIILVGSVRSTLGIRIWFSLNMLIRYKFHEVHYIISFGSTEWLCSDTRRTAVGLDFDVEALNWCMENNLNKFGSDLYSRISLFHGNVLNPLEAKLVKFEPKDLINNITKDREDGSDIDKLSTTLAGACACTNDKMTSSPLPPRDIVCAFNYSCCCLHSRQELISYFKYALSSLSKRGGIFVMDLYGGTSSECELKLQRRFPNFTVHVCLLT